MTDDDEPKNVRFNMFISKSEMDAIDEWSWNNRVRSKSEAVRRLVKIGLVFESSWPQFYKSIQNITQSEYNLQTSVEKIIDERALKDDFREQLEADLGLSWSHSVTSMAEFAIALAEMAIPINSYRGADDGNFEQLLSDVERLTAENQERLEAARAHVQRVKDRTPNK